MSEFEEANGARSSNLSKEEKMDTSANPTMKLTLDLPQATLDLDPDDEENSRNWNVKKKVAIACFVLLSSFAATLGTPIYIAAIPAVKHTFGVSTILAISPTSFYAFGLGIGALLGTAACEIYGRSIVYRVTVPVVFTFTLVGGFAKNFATLAVARSLAGLEKTGTLFALLFVMVVIWATQIGPMVSAAVNRFSWQWTFWITATLVGITMILSFLIPETYHPQVVRNKAAKLKLPLPPRDASFRIFITAVGRPLHMLIIEPVVFPTSLVMATSQAVVFAYYVVYALLFEQVYGFSQYAVGMTFAPLVIGSLFAVPIMGLSDRIFYQPARAEALRLGKTVAPEKRLYPAMLGSIILPISLFWLAWTGREDIHWIVPVLSGGLFGTAYVLNLFCLPIYTNDIYTIHYGASVQAANNFMRFLIAGAFPLFADQMVDKLGFAWATSLLGFVAVGLIPIPWVFFNWGPKLRNRSRYLKPESMEEVS